MPILEKVAYQITFRQEDAEWIAINSKEDKECIIPKDVKAYDMLSFLEKEAIIDCLFDKNKIEDERKRVIWFELPRDITV